MTSINLNLNSIDKVKGFVNIINTYDGDFDLASDRYVVDAKSIMGIFSLDLGSPVRPDIHDNAIAAKITNDLAAYVIQ